MIFVSFPSRVAIIFPVIFVVCTTNLHTLHTHPPPHDHHHHHHHTYSTPHHHQINPSTPGRLVTLVTALVNFAPTSGTSPHTHKDLIPRFSRFL